MPHFPLTVPDTVNPALTALPPCFHCTRCQNRLENCQVDIPAATLIQAVCSCSVGGASLIVLGSDAGLQVGYEILIQDGLLQRCGALELAGALYMACMGTTASSCI